MYPLNIFLVGEVSSGKSSFLNALAGGIISNSSLQRETTNIQEYQFDENAHEDNISIISTTLEQQHYKNEAIRKNISKIKSDITKVENKIKSDIFHNINMFDFPGLNDIDDRDSNIFMTMIKDNIELADMVIYITTSERAFNSNSELNHFIEVYNIVKSQNDNGKYVDLVVVVNKYDNINDKDYDDIYQRAQETLSKYIHSSNIFRFSSHKHLIDNIIKYKKCLYVPTFLRNEISKVLTNANVMMTKQIQRSVVKDGLLYHGDINIGNSISITLDDDLSDDLDSVSTHGDWDNIIDYIKNIQENIINKNSGVYYEYLMNQFYKIKILSEICPLIQLIDCGMVNNKINDQFQYYFGIMVNTYLNITYDDHLRYNRNRHIASVILTILIKYINAYPNMLDHITIKRDDIETIKILCVIICILYQENVPVPKTLIKKFKKFVKNKPFWNKENYYIYDSANNIHCLNNLSKYSNKDTQTYKIICPLVDKLIDTFLKNNNLSIEKLEIGKTIYYTHLNNIEINNNEDIVNFINLLENSYNNSVLSKTCDTYILNKIKLLSNKCCLGNISDTEKILLASLICIFENQYISYAFVKSLHKNMSDDSLGQNNIALYKTILYILSQKGSFNDDQIKVIVSHLFSCEQFYSCGSINYYDGHNIKNITSEKKGIFPFFNNCDLIDDFIKNKAVKKHNKVLQVLLSLSVLDMHYLNAMHKRGLFPYDLIENYSDVSIDELKLFFDGDYYLQYIAYQGNNYNSSQQIQLKHSLFNVECFREIFPKNITDNYQYYVDNYLD